MAKIELGDKVKDTITGFVGIAVGRTTWITGCARIVIQPVCKPNKLNEYDDSVSIDEPLLKVLKKAPKKKVDRNVGGPMAGSQLTQSHKKY